MAQQVVTEPIVWWWAGRGFIVSGLPRAAMLLIAPPGQAFAILKKRNHNGQNQGTTCHTPGGHSREGGSLLRGPVPLAQGHAVATEGRLKTSKKY